VVCQSRRRLDIFECGFGFYFFVDRSRRGVRGLDGGCRCFELFYRAERFGIGLLEWFNVLMFNQWFNVD